MPVNRPRAARQPNAVHSEDEVIRPLTANEMLDEIARVRDAVPQAIGHNHTGYCENQIGSGGGEVECVERAFSSNLNDRIHAEAVMEEIGIVSGLAGEGVIGCAAGESIRAGAADGVFNICNAARTGGYTVFQVDGHAAGVGAVIERIHTAAAIDRPDAARQRDPVSAEDELIRPGAADQPLDIVAGVGDFVATCIRDDDAAQGEAQVNRGRREVDRVRAFSSVLDQRVVCSPIITKDIGVIAHPALQMIAAAVAGENVVVR